MNIQTENLRNQIEEVREASLAMAVMRSEDKNEALEGLAKLLVSHKEFLLEANQLDLEIQKNQISEPLFQRLKLDISKIEVLARGCRDLIKIPDPVGQSYFKREIHPHLMLEKISVPIGVIAVIFESRPDVIPQILSLILKSGNAVVLKGGTESLNTNKAFISLISKLGDQFSFFPKKWAILLDSRESVQQILAYNDLIDLVIPRGSKQLVKMIQDNTKIPVLGHAEGICHMYIHEEADLEKATQLILNAKLQYPAACNAIETLLVDEASVVKVLTPLQSSKIQWQACTEIKKLFPQMALASEESWRTEYGDERLNVKMVNGVSEAINHINTFGSHHTDVIVSENLFVQEVFLSGVDSACVFANASSRFADGYKFGLGAEVGISTEKIHARGPVGVEGLVIYKYKLRAQ